MSMSEPTKQNIHFFGIVSPWKWGGLYNHERARQGLDVRMQLGAPGCVACAWPATHAVDPWPCTLIPVKWVGFGGECVCRSLIKASLTLR
jgi:hypothetical protein